jgi:hypothetical protein
MFFSIAELIEWRKLRRTRQGIDAAKLNVGDAKKKKKRVREEQDQGGLQKKPVHHEDDVECVPCLFTCFSKDMQLNCVIEMMR